MWSFKGITFVWCFVLFSATFALPVTKMENDPEPPNADPVLVEIEMPADEKPTDNSKPSEMAVDPKPIEAKPTEQTKPIEPSSPTTTFIETALPSSNRPHLLYDQRQDGKYNIRADLENFVILVVPSSGNSLLDLLKRSSQRQQQQQQQQQHNKRTHHTKHHKKYHSLLASVKPSEAKNYRPDGEEAAASGGEFIEGRTPYHVDISSDEILQPAPYGVRSLNGNAATIADLPLVNLDDNAASTSSDASDSTVILSTVSGKSSESIDSMPSSNTETSPRLPKSLTIDGYGNPITSLNTVILTRKYTTNHDQHDSQLSQNYNNYFSQKPSVQILDGNTVGINDNTHSPNVYTQMFDFTDSKTSFDSLNVGNIDRLALAGDSSTKADSDLANAQWELTLLGAEEQCGPDRRRDSYGVCQFVPADYATT